jgi:hypothetical protein
VLPRLRPYAPPCAPRCQGPRLTPDCVARPSVSPSPPQTPFASVPVGGSSGGGGDQVRVNRFDTSLPIRVDVGAALTYLVLGISGARTRPPVQTWCGALTGASAASLGLSGVIFLILEQKNDFIRFHAWQSVLVFCPLLVRTPSLRQTRYRG